MVSLSTISGTRRMATKMTDMEKSTEPFDYLQILTQVIGVVKFLVHSI